MERGPEHQYHSPSVVIPRTGLISLSTKFWATNGGNDRHKRWNFVVVETQEGSVRFKAIRNMKTKTAIISVDNLKSEDLPVLKQALQNVPGVDHVDFNLERSVAVIDFDPSQSHIDDFLRAVLQAGFKVL